MCSVRLLFIVWWFDSDLNMTHCPIVNLLTILLVAFEDGSAHLKFTIMLFPPE